MEPHDVILITEQSHPALFAAFELISHDCGRQAGHTNYVVPQSYKVVLPEIEQQLKTLREDADSDFEALCIGDSEDADMIVERYRLNSVNELLQRFFEEFS